MVKEDSNYRSIVRLFLMHNSKSGSLPNKIGYREGPQKSLFWLIVCKLHKSDFTSPKDSPIDQDHAYEVWFLNSKLCRN